MMLGRAYRKPLLTLHVVASVGWLGSVSVFVTLALIALNTDQTETRRSVYLLMEPLAWYSLLPLAVATFLTGVVQALVTPWGLFRHYWVLFKLAITVVATIVLISYMPTFGDMANAAAAPNLGRSQLAPYGSSVLLHGGLALAGLLLATVLSIYKPRGTLRAAAPVDRALAQD